MKNIIHQALENTLFRRVVDTGKHTQVVIMSVEGEIGEEVHHKNDQLVYLVEGAGKSVLNGIELPFEQGDMILVDAGTRHNFVNYGDGPMKIITTYSPPNHPPGTIHTTKEDADSSRS